MGFMSTKHIAELKRALREHKFAEANRVLSVIAESGDVDLNSQANEIVEQFDLGKVPERPAGRYVLSPQETREFLMRFVWLGSPERVPYAGRGRPSRRTQYDDARARRKSAYQKFVRLPSVRASAKAARRRSGEPLRKQVAALAEKFGPRKNLARDIATYQHLRPSLLQCTETHVRRILRKIGISRK